MHFMNYIKANKSGCAALLFALLFCKSPVCVGKTYAANPDNYLASLKKFSPGDHLRLRPGEYKQGLLYSSLLGYTFSIT